MATMAIPRFLMVPPLYRGGAETVSWERLPAAARYELDLVFDQDFETAGRGRSWADLAMADRPWSAQDSAAGRTWAALAALPAQGLAWRSLELKDRTWRDWDADTAATWRWMQTQPVSFTVYGGPGADVAAPDQGLTWASVDATVWNWAEQESASAYRWDDFRQLPTPGLQWWQHHGGTWREMENRYGSWSALETQPARALHWCSLEARWRTWRAMESLDHTWWALEQLPPDDKMHRGWRIDIPADTDACMLRVRAFDKDGMPSGYLTTALIPHLSVAAEEEEEPPAPCEAPAFLLVPPLYEESAVTVTWQDVPGAQRYELDMVFDQDFGAAGRGKSWSDLALAGWSWRGQSAADAVSWSQLAALPAQGLMWRNLRLADRTWSAWHADATATWRWIQTQPVSFTLYSGPGEERPAPDQGLTWADIHGGAWSWREQAGAAAHSWRAFYLLVSPQPSPGLCWSSMDGRWLAWRRIEALGDKGGGLTWRELAQLPPDTRTNRGLQVDIPLYTKSSMLRVRAFDAQGEPTDYLTTALLSHRPRSLKNHTVPCLHTPALREGESADISWGDLYGAAGYVVERRTGSGTYEIRYNGAGRGTTAPAGCGKPAEHYYGPDCKQHLAFTDPLPYNQKTAQYRIRGYNATDSSGYLTGPSTSIIPVFYREGKTQLQVRANTTAYLQLGGSKAWDFSRVPLTLRYDAAAIRLVSLAAQFVEPFLSTGTIPGTDVEIISLTQGEIRFRVNAAVAQTQACSRFITILECTSLKNTATEVTLQ